MGFDKTAATEFFVTSLLDLNGTPGTLQPVTEQARKKFGGFLCFGGKEAELTVLSDLSLTLSKILMSMIF